MQYDFSDSDMRVLRELIRESKASIRNVRSRPQQEHAYSEAEDHQAPEVYIAYPRDDPDMDDEGGTGTGTYWERNPALKIPGIIRATDAEEFDKIYAANCDLYRIIVEGTQPYEIRPICGRDNKEECGKKVFNVSESSIVDSFAIAIRNKGGQYLSLPTHQMVKCMLAEDHPGRHTPGDSDYEFDVWPGVWCPYDRAWRFPCDDDTMVWTATDSFYGGSTFDTWPDKYSQCWCVIKPAPGLRDNICYSVVTGDCESDDDCTTWQLPCSTGT